MLILIDALSISGLLLTQHGHHQEAHKELNEAWNLACEHKLRATLPLLGLELGRIDVINGNIERAEITIASARREAAALRPSPKAAALCELMADIRQSRGNEVGMRHWRNEATGATPDFDALKQQVRMEIAKVTGSLQA